MIIKNKNHIKRGFSIFETLLTALISLALASQFIQQMRDSDQSIKATNVALKMRTLVNASENYIKANSTSLLNEMSDNQIIFLPLTGDSGPVPNTLSLTNSGVIPTNYNFQFPYNQKPIILIKKVPIISSNPNQLQKSRLESLVTTYDGYNYSDRLLGEVVQKIGAKGGALMNTTLPTAPIGTLQGAYGTWSYPSSYWTSGSYPITCGHQSTDQISTPKGSISCGRPLGISTNAGGVISDYLDRYDIGSSEANTMHTDIDFNGFSLRNVNTLDGVSGQNLYISSSESQNNVVTQNNIHLCSSPNNINGCGIVFGDRNSTLMNESDGWTTLTQNQKGFRITGGASPNLQLQGALMIDGEMQNPSTTVAGANPGGLIFSVNMNNWLSGDSFGAHMYQDNPQYLTITGGNGFSGLYINNQNNQPARIQLLYSQLYGDSNGLLSIRVGNGASGVYIKHTDGSQADLTVDAMNLGTSIGRSEDGEIYTAIIGKPCSPNGRIATIANAYGEVAVCHMNIWSTPSAVNPSDNDPKFSTIISSFDGSGSYTNTGENSLMLIAHNHDFSDNVYYGRLSDGTISCVMNQGGRHSISRGNTCTFILPRGISFLGGLPQSTIVDVYK